MNVLHCCPHKSASQWIRAIVRDPMFYAASGLTYHFYYENLPDNILHRKVTESRIDEAFPENTVISPLYISYDNYVKIPQNGERRAFYVMRDPRDILVSYYFSHRYSHTMNPIVELNRERLSSLGIMEGFEYCLDRLIQRGSYDAMRTWAGTGDESVIVVRYEDLVGEDFKAHFRRVLDHCRINISDADLAALLDKNSFERLSGERKRGQEDVLHHFRKGVAGDWKNHFTADFEKLFAEKTGDLVTVLGYK
jgi:hypothetical protein